MKNLRYCLVLESHEFERLKKVKLSATNTNIYENKIGSCKFVWKKVTTSKIKVLNFVKNI